MTLLRPRPLPKGGGIGIFSPSMPAAQLFRERYQHGVAELRRVGYTVVEGELTRSASSQGYRSGTPSERAKEFMSLIRDPRVHCLMSSIGGFNTLSMLDLLDYDAIRASRKLICGYSDVTALHCAVAQEAGLGCIYGPAVMPSIGEWPRAFEFTMHSFEMVCAHESAASVELTPPTEWTNTFLNALTDEWKTGQRVYQPNEGWKTLVGGAARGPLFAANLDTLLALAGTRYFPSLVGAVLFIEEEVSGDARFERAMHQLHQTGVLTSIAALVIGKFEKYSSSGGVHGFSEIVCEVARLAPGLPIIVNFDCGHTYPMLSLPIGVQAQVVATVGTPARIILEGNFVQD